MSTYYIGADVHNNSTELAIEKRNKIIARYTVPTTIPAISNVLDSLLIKHLKSSNSPLCPYSPVALNFLRIPFIVSAGLSLSFNPTKLISAF